MCCITYGSSRMSVILYSRRVVVASNIIRSSGDKPVIFTAFGGPIRPDKTNAVDITATIIILHLQGYVFREE